MGFIHFLMAVLSAYRLTELFAVDKITEKFRKKFPGYLWNCGRCLSVWAGLASTAAFVFCPWLNWPLALSWLVFVISDLRGSSGRKFLAVVDSRGLGRVVKSELEPEEMASMCNSLFPRKAEEKKETI